MSHSRTLSHQNHIVRLACCQKTSTIFFLVLDGGLAYLTGCKNGEVLSALPPAESIKPEIRQELVHALDMRRKHGQIPADICLCLAHSQSGQLEIFSEMLPGFSCHHSSVDRITGLTYEALVEHGRRHFSGNGRGMPTSLHVIDVPLALAV